MRVTSSTHNRGCIVLGYPSTGQAISINVWSVPLLHIPFRDYLDKIGAGAMTAPPGGADVGGGLGAEGPVKGVLAVRGSGGAEIVIVWRGLLAPSVAPSVPGKIASVGGKGAANDAVGVVATAGGCWRGGNRPLCTTRPSHFDKPHVGLTLSYASGTHLATSLTTGTLGLITDLSMASGCGGDAIGAA